MKATWLSPAVLGKRWSAQVINRQAALAEFHAHQTVPLGELCQVQSGRYIDEYVPFCASDDIAPYLRVDNIRPFVANMNRQDLAYVRVSHPRVLPRSVIREGDVLIARTGTLGKACLAVGELVGGILSQHVTRLTIREQFCDKVTPECLCAFLNARPGRTQLLAGGAGSTRLELTHARLSAVCVPLVEKECREELTMLVRRGAEALARAGRLIREAVDLYNAVFRVGQQGSAGRGIWVQSERVAQTWAPKFHCLGSDRWIHDVPQDYVVVPLCTVVDTARGKGTRSADYVRSGIPFVRTTSLINGGIDPFPDHYASPETDAKYNQQTEEGDMLLSIEGKIGQVAYLTGLDHCVFKNHIEHIRPKDRCNSAHIFLALASEVGQSQMRKLTVVQATLPGLASRSRQILIPVPRTSERRESAGGPLAKALACLSEGLEQRKGSLEALPAAASLVDSIFS